MRAPRAALLALVLLAGLIAPPARPAEVTHAQTAALTQPGCGYDSQVDALLNDLNQDSYTTWIRQLSGGEDVFLSGTAMRINTRYSISLFDGVSPGFDYLYSIIRGWYPDAQIEIDEFPAPGHIAPERIWKNLVLTIPGAGAGTAANEVVILSAHLDSTSSTPTLNAPGADDNASGSAALIEAARVLRGKALPRTLKLIWFTGEEQWLVGSNAYTQDHPLDNIIGVVNVDMIGYDGDGDRCFEIHAGTLPQSNRVGQCFTRAINVYDLDLTYDYLINNATIRSDHAAFWAKGIGAVEVLENGSNNPQPNNGCQGLDINPYYHTPNDTLANMHPAYSFAVAKASIAAAFSLASPVELHVFYMPVLLKNDEKPQQ